MSVEQLPPMAFSLVTKAANGMLAALILALPLKASADEGMWLYNAPPSQLLRERHRFDVSEAWLEHLQKSSVHFNRGGSASFVSEDGLLISNHHVGAGAVQKLSTAERNLLRDGFLARKPAQEIPCPSLELTVLQSITDVTARVNAAVPAGTDETTAFHARRRVIAEIERESFEQTGLRSDVVTLWQGAAYHLYRSHRYTDVRLVFVPEQAIAFFGGDVDNFEFPRFNLDVAFFRAYENGQPARVEHFLRLASRAPQEGDLVFVSGHPGRTSRLLTVAELQHQRDVVLPWQLARLKWREVLLDNWSKRSAENARRANRALLGVENGRKALDGRLAGLLDPTLFQSKATAEAAFKERLHTAGDLSEAIEAFDRITAAMRTLGPLTPRYHLLERGEAFRCESFQIARTLLRAGEEFTKPDGERLEEYSQAGRVSLELGLFSPQPIYEDLEQLTLADSLTYLACELGADDPLVQKVLAGQSPQDRAVELIRTTRVRDLAVRRQLYDGGMAAVDAAKDPMIELARLVDHEARALREAADAQHETLRQAHAAIAAARNAFNGTEGYPDATGTLRLSFGEIRGYEEPSGEVPAFTTLAGLYQRAAEMNERPPFDLPTSWQKRRRHLDLDTPFNFVSTCDIIGGNSGSPVVNQAGEFVGIIFDGNLAGLPWDYAFNDQQGRAIAVDAAAILESLKNVYGAKELVRELKSERR